MPWSTTGLGCSMDRTGAPSWTSVEVKLDDWDCLSLSLQEGNITAIIEVFSHAER